MRWRLGLLILAFATLVGLGGMVSVAQVGAPVGAEQATAPIDQTEQMKELLLKLNEENNELESQIASLHHRRAKGFIIEPPDILQPDDPVSLSTANEDPCGRLKPIPSVYHECQQRQK